MHSYLMIKKKTSWKHKLAAILFSCLVILIVVLLGELACRMFTRIQFLETSRYLFTPRRFGISFGNTPNLEAMLMSARINIDENGFRYDPEFRSAAPPDAPTILIVGDSVPFGPGVAEKYTMASLMSHALPNERIYNLAVPGYDTFDYKNVTDIVVSQKPNIKTVLLFYCLNDVSNVSAEQIRAQTETFEDPDKPKEAQSLSRRINDYLRTRSKLYLWLRSWLYDSSKNYFLSDTAFYFNKDDEALKPAWQPLADLNESLTRSGIKFKVFLMPYEAQVRPNTPPEYLKPQERVAKFLKEHNIDYYDATPDFKQAKAPDELFILGDPMHLSADGHRIAAQVMCKEIEEKCTIQ